MECPPRNIPHGATSGRYLSNAQATKAADLAKRAVGPRLTPRRTALRLATVYTVVGVAWIVFSDRVLGDFGFPPRLQMAVGTAKGIAFVLVTATVLYTFSNATGMRLQHAQAALREQEMGIRRAYVEVLDAVTGGKLVLVTAEELSREFGSSLMPPRRVDSGEQLAEVRERIREVAGAVLPREAVGNTLSAVGEALNNVLKHAGSGSYEVLRRDGVLQVKVSDEGPGIDFRTLPKATLMPGFSTAQTLGMGFTIMLQLAERVLICTEPGSTTVMLEFAG